MPAADYLPELQQAAAQHHLAADPYWHRLVHYRPHLAWPGYTSVIDSPEFFLAPDGHSDPDAELAATLAAFFGDEAFRDEPAQCRFKARYEWLSAQLRFDAERLPPRKCELYDKWAATIDGAREHVVFASSDMGSPSTMYGHTLLRIDGRGLRSGQPLLSTAVGYAATVGDVDPFSYVALGLGGGFVGEFSLGPYHEKVREYSRIDHRDLWEYPLRLDEAELRRMLWHLWELRSIGSDYYFLSENCSYMLLSLIETARPGLSLTAGFDDPLPYTIPLDTIRVLRDAGLLEPPVYRPSQARKLKAHFAQLRDDTHDWVLEYAAGDATLEDPRLTQAAERDRARMLETASDYLFFRFGEGKLPRDPAVQRAQAALFARSEVKVKADFDDIAVPSTAPDQGHESSRLDFGWRHAGGDDAALWRARGAYHDRLDPPAGYLAGGELEFFTLSVLADRHDVTINEARMVNVQAVAPWDRDFKPWSWQASFGVRRYGLDALATRPVARLGGYADGGPGIAVQVGNTSAYSFALASLDVNRDVPDGYALAGGLRVGFAVQASPVTLQLEADALDHLAGGAEPQRYLRAGTQWQLAARDGLRFEATRGEYDHAAIRGVELRWLHYF